MSAKSKKHFRSLVEKNYGKKTADEIVGMIDKMMKEGKDPEKIHEEVSQYFLRHLQEDVNSVLAQFDHIPTFTGRYIGRN